MSFLFGGSGSTTTYANQNTTANTRYSPESEALTAKILNRASELGDRPYEPYTGDMFADLTEDQKAGFQKVRDTQGVAQPYFDTAKGILNRVGGAGYDPLTNAQPYLNRAGSAINPWEAGAGMTADSAAGWTTPGVRENYMGDYTEGAINRANELSTRNFTEKTMPGINAQFTKGQGQLGRRNYNKFAGRAVRDLANEQSGNAQTLMDQAYFKAAQIYGTDKAREMQAAGQLGSLARSSIDADTNLATATSNITQGAVQTGLGVSNAYTQQAGALNNINLQNADALMKSGAVQQQDAQRDLTAKYMQDREAKQWDFEKVNFMNAASRGLNVPTTQTSNTSSNQTQSSGSSPSVLGQVMGGAGIIGSIPGIGDALGGIFGGGTLPGPANGVPQNTGAGSGTTYGRGGYIRRYANGGPVGRRRFAQGGQAFGPITEPKGMLSRRSFAVGGDVPVMRGLNGRGQNAMPPALPPPPAPPPMGLPMMPPGALSGGLPPPLRPPMGALGGLETMP